MPGPQRRGARTSVRDPTPDTHHGASEHQQLDTDAGTHFRQHCWSLRPRNSQVTQNAATRRQRRLPWGADKSSCGPWDRRPGRCLHPTSGARRPAPRPAHVASNVPSPHWPHHARVHLLCQRSAHPGHGDPRSPAAPPRTPRRHQAPWAPHCPKTTQRLQNLQPKVPSSNGGLGPHHHPEAQRLASHADHTHARAEHTDARQVHGSRTCARDTYRRSPGTRITHAHTNIIQMTPATKITHA